MSAGGDRYIAGERTRNAEARWRDCNRKIDRQNLRRHAMLDFVGQRGGQRRAHRATIVGNGAFP